MKKNIHLILSVLLLALANYGYGQENNFRRQLKEADDYYKIGDYQDALRLFLPLYKNDTSDFVMGYKVGICMYNLKRYRREAFPYFEKAVEKGINEAHYYLGNIYHLRMRFDDAIAQYDAYASFTGTKEKDEAEIKRLKKITLTASEMVKQPIDVYIENMGKEINSSSADYAPLISPDEDMILFTSRREGCVGNFQDPTGEYFEDIYVSWYQDGKWTEPEGLSDSINTETHEATVALSPGGDILYLYRTNEFLTGGNIYQSKFDGNEWSAPVKLNSEINSEDGWESSASISADGNTIYFSSNREGGFGGKDLYRLVKLPNGAWSKALSLGPVINSIFNEDFPFIHPDGKTLYFSSLSHLNMGGYDIFRTTVDEFGQCTAPENIGYPINTVDDDVCFVLSTDGEQGYYSTVRADSYGFTDIYRITMPGDRPKPPVIRGKVLAVDDPAKIIRAKITLLDDETQKLVGLYNTNSKTGKFIMAVALGKKYKLLIEAEGYYPYTDKFPVTSIPSAEFVKIIKLVKKENVKSK